MINLGKVDIKGIDVTAEASGQINCAVTWFTRFAYTFQRAIDITSKASVYCIGIPFPIRRSFRFGFVQLAVPPVERGL